MLPEGYIFQYEYSQATCPPCIYFFFDGSKHQQDISIAQYISDYWQKITKNQGSCFICNMKKDQYRYCGIGMIHYSDLKKQSFLIKNRTSICVRPISFSFFLSLKISKDFSEVNYCNLQSEVWHAHLTFNTISLIQGLNYVV